jgi:hypothetical protein
MKVVTRTFSRCMAVLLVCALVAVSAPVAQAKPLTTEKVHERILKRGIGNWVGIELQNGTAFVGRIVSADDEGFGMQLHNDPAITPVRYADVVEIHTGLSHGAFWGITIGAIGASVAFALIAHHEFVENEPKLPNEPTQPVFPY